MGHTRKFHLYITAAMGGTEVFSAVGCATASLCYATGLASTGAIIEKV
jgi:hypothetical protein